MKTIFLAFFVTFLVTVAHCDDVNDETLLKPRFIRAGKHYYISTDQAPFVGASIACKTGGMTLATVPDEEAQSELYNATVEAQYYNTDGYWIGAASSYPYSSNNFYWINNGIRVIYTNWGSNQPRYINGLGYGGCVKLGNTYKTNEPTKWASIDCNRLLSYVCEFTN